MIRTISILPLSAGLLSLVLMVLALSTSRRRNRTMLYFELLNAATAIWSLTYAVFLNLRLPGDGALSAPGSPTYFLFLLAAIGAAAAPTYWFLFAASYARRGAWTRGWPLAIAHVPLAYTILVAGTNPWHYLFIRESSLTGATTYGPLAVGHQLGTFVLVGLGIWLIVGSSWKRGTAAGRRQAIVLGCASMVPMIGGLLWSTRLLTGLPLEVNLTPVLFPVLNTALAYELVRTGLADIVPYAALQAFNAISDAGIALDLDGTIAASNAAAQELIPGCEPGVPLREAWPELADAVAPCLRSASDYTGFDLDLGDRLFWGRARPMRDRRALPMGHIILLTDVTDIRMTKAKIVQLEREAGLGTA